MYFENIQQEIGSKYKKQNHQKMAEKCLQLGEEWTRIVSGDLTDFSRFRVPAGADPKRYKKDLEEECKRHIKDSLSQDDVKSFFPVWVLPFVVQIFLSAMISWIVQRLLNNLFDNHDEE